MALGYNGLTIASHLVMVIILVMLACRALRTFHKGLGGIAVQHGLMAVIAIACVALTIERSYYIAARFLRSQDLNLWELHPAPEILSIVVSVGVYSLMIPLMWAQLMDRQSVMLRVMSEAVLLIVVWFSVVWVLY